MTLRVRTADRAISAVAELLAQNLLKIDDDDNIIQI